MWVQGVWGLGGIGFRVLGGIRFRGLGFRSIRRRGLGFRGFRVGFRGSGLWWMCAKFWDDSLWLCLI